MLQRVVTKPDVALPLFSYMIEREAIRQRREAGLPGPWTDDPILREYSFTNVRRSDDRTTRKLMADFYGPNVAAGARPGDVLFHAVLARNFGNADGVVELGWQHEWNPEAFAAKAHAIHAERRLFTTAYVISNNGESSLKVDVVVRMLTVLWPMRHRIAESAMQTCYGWENLCSQLRKVKGLGGTGFAAKEAAQDFIQAIGWKPRDLNTFTPVGKGARRGLNRLHGRAVDDSITSSSPKVESRFLREVRALFDVRQQFLPAGFVELQLHDIQFCLCELDKYLRTKTGDGKPKRRYGK